MRWLASTVRNSSSYVMLNLIKLSYIINDYVMMFLDVMGQSLSNDLDKVDSLPEDLFRQARQLSQVATLSFEEFQEYLKQLNEL